MAFGNENIVLVVFFRLQVWPAGNWNYNDRELPQLAETREQGDDEKGDEIRGKRGCETGQRE